MGTTMRMVWMCGVVAAALLLVAGCDDQRMLPEDSTDHQRRPEMEGQRGTACSVDSDCIRAGCSGTVCQSRDAEAIITTCEWREEYACFRDIECGCVQERCVWQASPEFEACIEEKRQSG